MNDHASMPQQDMLPHKFRIEDHVVAVLIEKLQNAHVKPTHAGNIAQAVLQMVSRAYSRKDLQTFMNRAAEVYPELGIVSMQEEVYVKEEAEKIIKTAVEKLLEEGQIDEALRLAKTINNGEIPDSLKQLIEQI